MGVLAVIGSVLEILKEFLVWQVALTKIQAQKVAYDIDQVQLARGRDLRAKIDSARSADDLSALSLYLDDQSNAALYAARVRSAIPDNSRDHVGIGSGVPTGGTPGSGSSDGVKPTAQPKPNKS